MFRYLVSNISEIDDKRDKHFEFPTDLNIVPSSEMKYDKTM